MATSKAPKATKQELSLNTYIAAAAVITILVVGASGYATYGLAKSILFNGKVITAKSKVEADLTQKLDAAPKLVQAYKDLGPAKDLIFYSLPTTSDFPQIVSIADNMATAAGIKLASVSEITTADAAVAAPTAGAATGAAPVPTGPAIATPTTFSVSVVGNYNQFQAYIKNIETSSRPMRINSIQMSGTNNTINADITITTYWQGKANIDDTTEVIK